jgi:hypothetical protein
MKILCKERVSLSLSLSLSHHSIASSTEKEEGKKKFADKDINSLGLFCIQSEFSVSLPANS